MEKVLFEDEVIVVEDVVAEVVNNELAFGGAADAADELETAVV